MADATLCDKNAECVNTEGSVACTCKAGYTGNGTYCQGKKDVMSIAQTESELHLSKFFFSGTPELAIGFGPIKGTSNFLVLVLYKARDDLGFQSLK